MTTTEQIRAELKERRDHGLQQRHQQRLDRVLRCRYLDTYDNRCESPALDPNAELQLCVRHTAAAIVMIRSITERASDLLPTPKETP